MGEKNIVVGIDLGTTNSCIAFWDKYKVEVIPNDYGERTTPSVVHFINENEYCIGLDALAFLKSEPESTIYSIKRVIGLNFDSTEVEKFKKDWAFKLVRQERNKIGIEIEANHSKFTTFPETISCYILKKLKSDAENYLKIKSIKKAVVAVPYYFNNSQKEATISAANMAGFEEVVLINEPTAASVAFSFDKILEKEEKKIVIFDLGGGTFDVSLLTIEEGLIEVICVNGDTKLGGNDIDLKLLEYIEMKIKTSSDFKNLPNIDEIINQRKEKIKSICEFVKKNLTKQEKSEFKFHNFYENKDISIEISRKVLENLCTEFKEKLKAILDKLFTDAKKKKKKSSYSISKIDHVILIGGSTKIPLIKTFVQDYFGKEPITSLNPDESIAIGAALRGESLFNNSPYLNSLQLIDVIPLNIGIMVDIDDKFKIILKRNSYIPCRNKEIFVPLCDYASRVEIKIYEGVNKYCKDNNFLGSFFLEITPKPKHLSKIEISLVIDEHLILHVSAEQISEGKSKEIHINRKNQILTNDELKSEKEKIEKNKIPSINQEEKEKYSLILDKQKYFFSSENIKKISDGEINTFIKLIEDYISKFTIQDYNIHFTVILIHLYNLCISRNLITIDSLEYKIEEYLEKISKIDIFYSLNFISKYNLETKFQEKLSIQIASFFYKKGSEYLCKDTKKNKKISFQLFQSSEKIIDNLFTLNDRLKTDQTILELIEENEQYLRDIKIVNLSSKIEDIYNKNNKDANKIIKLYYKLANLISSKLDINYLDLQILYKLGNESEYSANIIEILEQLYLFFEDDNNDNCHKKLEIKNNLEILKKSIEQSKNVNSDYFKNDFNDEEYEKHKTEIQEKYDKKNPKEFISFILDKFPPLSLIKTIDEIKKMDLDKALKFLNGSYGTNFTRDNSKLINKDKLREKIKENLSYMHTNYWGDDDNYDEGAETGEE